MRQINNLARRLRLERHIRVARPYTALGQHAVDLAAMMRLVVEHVRDEQGLGLGDVAIDRS
jgi:hypothetical protein